MSNPLRDRRGRIIVAVVLVLLVAVSPVELITKALLVGVPGVIYARRYLAARGTSFRALLSELRPRGGRLDH